MAADNKRLLDELAVDATPDNNYPGHPACIQGPASIVVIKAQLIFRAGLLFEDLWYSIELVYYIKNN